MAYHIGGKVGTKALRLGGVFSVPGPAKKLLIVLPAPLPVCDPSTALHEAAEQGVGIGTGTEQVSGKIWFRDSVRHGQAWTLHH